jgi:hypothetical protein
MLDWLHDAFEWLADAISDVLEEITAFFLSGVAALLEAIPVPQWMTGQTNILGQIPSGMAWGLQWFELQYGATVFISALTIRFLIRRIPVIG